MQLNPTPIDPSQTQAEEFIKGFEDTFYTINNNFFSPLKIHPSEIKKIFSSTQFSPAIIGQLREKIAAAILDQPSKNCGEKLQSVDRYIRLFFASNFEDLSDAAITHYGTRIQRLNDHPIRKQPNEPEITLETIFSCLGSLGEDLKAEIEVLGKVGLKSYVDSVRNFLYNYINGKQTLKDFIQSIGKLKDIPFKDRLNAVKRNLGTLIEATEQLQLISDKNRTLLIIRPTLKSLEDIKDKFFKKYQGEPFPLDLTSEELVGKIGKFESEFFSDMQKREFFFNKKEDDFDLANEPSFIEEKRTELVKRLQPAQLIQILETSKFSNRLQHWKTLCFEAMKGKETEYLNHLTLKDVDWKTYPWSVFLQISRNCSAGERLLLGDFFEKHAHAVSETYFGQLVELFFKSSDRAKIEKLSKDILDKCSLEKEKLSFLLNEEFHFKNNFKETWNNLILDKVDFKKHLEAIAEFCATLPKKHHSAYFRIFDYVKTKKSKLLLDQFCQYVEKHNQSAKNVLTEKHWNQFSLEFSDWCWNYKGSLDRGFYEIALPTPIEGYEIAASTRFQDRTKPGDFGGLFSGIASKLEASALTSISSDIGLPFSPQIKDAATLIQKKMDDSTFCSFQINSIFASQTMNVNPIRVENQKKALLNFILDKARKLGEFPEDFLLIPASIPTHGMQLTIIKQPQGVGKEPKLIVLLTNTGMGIENHPSVEGPPRKYATTAKVGEITQAQLTDENFWKSLMEIFTALPTQNQTKDDYSITQVKTLYKTLNKHCGKREDNILIFLKHSENFYPVKRMQHGEVCEVSSVRDITKTLFDLILFEKNKNNPFKSFADSYLQSELAMEYINKWIAKRYLKAQSPNDDISGKQLKIDKKGASTFEEFADSKMFPEARQFLINQIFGKTHKPVKDHSTIGSSARELKDLTKELVNTWLRGNKRIEDVQKLKGHPILEVAKQRFEYKRKTVDQALNHIKDMEKEEINLQNSGFVINVFQELLGFGAEPILIDQLKKSIPKMQLKANNSLLLVRLMELMNKDEPSKQAAVKIIAPYIKRLVERSSEWELSSYDSLLVFWFGFLAENEVMDILKPVFKSLANRPIALGEFNLIKSLLDAASEKVATEIIKNLVSSANHRKIPAHEVLFPFLLSMHLVARENNTKLNGKKINIVLVAVKHLESTSDQKYLLSLFPEVVEALKAKLS